MSRYIDADAVRNPYSGTSLEWQGVVLLKLLDDAPSIDIAPRHIDEEGNIDKDFAKDIKRYVEARR